MDARAEGESDAVDLLPLPPIAGEVTFKMLIFASTSRPRWWLRMSVLMFLQVLLCWNRGSQWQWQEYDHEAAPASL